MRLHNTLEPKRHRDHMHEPPAPGILTEEPPGHLSELAQQTWRYSVQNAPAAVLTAIDANLLAIYCEATARWQQAYERQKKLPLLIKSRRTGDPVPSPLLTALQTPWSAVRANRASHLQAERGWRHRHHSRPSNDPSNPRTRLRLLQRGGGDVA